ncbi:ABC transporter permease [Oceanobacillus sp. CFH 90083]|uniref:ABC transporter permease n=1 Tax=Oceanobacillus sp. CFH 90083 TaxID=2592336 RepID=UPI00188465E7|nr:ABC transporter permease [Oceanobacillus sp. CFH 90083]
MINLLKMDLNRFFTNKIMYVLLLVFIACQVFGIFMLKQYEQPDGQGEVLISNMNESEFIQMMLSQTPSWILMYIAVFTVYFYMSEYNAGFYKNYISIKNARRNSVISKILMLGIFTLLMFFIMIIADLIGRSLFFQNAAFGGFGYFARLVAGQILLHWAFSVVVLCAAMLIKNAIPSIVTGIILGLNVIGIAAGALESLISDTNLTSYLLVNTIVSIKDFNHTADVIHVAGVAIIFLVLFSILAVKYKMKEDLK